MNNIISDEKYDSLWNQCRDFIDEHCIVREIGTTWKVSWKVLGIQGCSIYAMDCFVQTF